MKITEIKPLIPYKAVTSSLDKTITKGQIIWLSTDGGLCIPSEYGGGVLNKGEWEDLDFEVEHAIQYKIQNNNGCETLLKI